MSQYHLSARSRRQPFRPFIWLDTFTYDQDTQVTTVMSNSVAQRSTFIHTGQESDRLISGIVAFITNHGLGQSTLIPVGSTSFIQLQVAKELSMETSDYISLRSHQRNACSRIRRQVCQQFQDQLQDPHRPQRGEFQQQPTSTGLKYI